MDVKVTGNNQHGFTESKFYLRNLKAFYDETISYANDGKTVDMIYPVFSKVWSTNKAAWSTVSFKAK